MASSAAYAGAAPRPWYCPGGGGQQQESQPLPGATTGGAGATTVVGKGPSWHWLSSKHHRIPLPTRGLTCAATRAPATQTGR